MGTKITKEAVLNYHSQAPAGKLSIQPTKPLHSLHQLAMAYSPGVAIPCEEIARDPAKVYEYTAKGNLVAVISNGTAVLGLGHIGPEAAKPVMEGKALLFKKFAGIDAFDLELNLTDPKAIVEVVKALAPTFGGINLEDIKAPECFYIEEELKRQLAIPVMHDDQHGTAIVVGAALKNALLLVNKPIAAIQIVINGAGAGAIACAKLLIAMGVQANHIIMCDSQGVIRHDRPHLELTKAPFATDRNLFTLADAMHGADVFLGLSKADLLQSQWILSMNKQPIIFALANPNPEISYEAAMTSRSDIIMATGRSDYPNQVNNVLSFPYIFRGALDVQATDINQAMQLAAVHALAALAQEEVPTIVKQTYAVKELSFGAHYLIPKPVDPRLLTKVSMSVAQAAIESGVAQRPMPENYVNNLHQRLI
jgi:malic enzyme